MAQVVPGQTVEELVHYWSQVEPDTEAFVSLAPDTYERRVLTRSQVHELARKFAASLRQLGVAKGDVVCVCLPNCLERVVADLGTICCGAVALNGTIFRADGQDFLQALTSSKAKAVVTDADPSRGAWQFLKDHVPELDSEVTCERFPHLRRVITCQRSEDPAVDFFSRLLNYSKSLQRAHALTSDLAVIWTTSGSTGFSKLVPQTHGNLIHIALQVMHISRLKSGDKFVNCAPLGWAGGFPIWFLASGVTRVFLDTYKGTPANMAEALWECVQREKGVYVFTSPMYVSAVLEKRHLWQADGTWLPRGICIAGQPMKRTLMAAVGKLCQYIDINYGTTECGVIASTRVADADSYHDGATGPPAVGVQVRIVDDQLRDVTEGRTGEILARSPALYGSYMDNEEATRRAFTKDGWFRSDDVGYFLPDGQIVHLGRQTDAIMRGVFICYPGWLETLLRRAPGVLDVCVVPVPDPVLHHEICACVIPDHKPPASDLEASLRAFADSQLLTQPGESLHLVPKYYIFLEKLPLTATGKISRKDVCSIANEHLGLST